MRKNMKIIAGVLIMVLIGNMNLAASERSISLEVTVNAPIEDVWNAWTTEEGVKSFFSPGCKVELKVDGAYEMYFAPDAPEGQRGGDGNKILAIQNLKMLSFTWNAPPSLPEARKQRTHVTVRFNEISENSTSVILHHDGWGVGGEWDKAFEYFTKAWGKVVLPRLKYRFEHGPINWENPPEIGQ